LVRQALGYRPAACRLGAVAVVGAVSLAAYKGMLPLVSVPLGVTVQAIAIAYLVCSYSLIEGGWVFKVLNNRALVGIGVLSYSLYIWQQLLLVPSSSGPLWWQIFPQNIALTLVVAYLSYRCVESPFLRLKAKLGY